MRVASRRPLGPAATSDIRTAFKTFKPALAGQSGRMGLAIVLSLAVTGLELLRPWPVTWVIDRLVAADVGAGDASSVALAPIAVFAALAMLVPTLMGLANERLELVVAKVSRKATVRIRSDVFEHVQRMELDEHHRHYSGDLLVRVMGDVNMIRDLLFPSWLGLLSRGSTLIGGAVVFALVDWRLFLAALVPLPLLWVTVEQGSSAIKAAAGKQRKKEGAIASSAAESLRQVGIIKAFAAEELTAKTFRDNARSAERSTMAATKQSARMSRLTEILTGGGVALVLMLGASRVRAGLISPGELLVAISYTRMMYKPLRKLTGEGARVAKATACALRVIDLLDRPAEDPHRGHEVSSLAGHIDLIDLHHRYPDGRGSLDGLSVRIPHGSFTAVTGENGTGKSTLLSLLLRLHRPTKGEIRIGGISIDDLRLEDYRRQIAFVPQELALFGGTVRENIAFGNPGATDEQIMQAAKTALFEPVLARMPEGLDTVLDESGTSLSGGQARRLMLARAAVRDASVLLLDEPLS
ncbi:MAG: ABC transporter ATP-binding protein, partial [Acidimicrobiales bacterium]|nr:ABC transporter ATP-binding protein [Acidimicrobiales bacterium]